MNKDPVEISVVVPIFRCSEFTLELCDRLNRTLKRLHHQHEIILVDDCSPDRSWDKIKEASKLYPSVEGIRLSRNFGQHNAIAAGLDLTRGRFVVIMDGDLQDPPEAIEALYEKCNENYDAVFAQRTDRQDSFFKRAWSRVFWKLLNSLVDTEIDPAVGNFGIFSRRLIDAVQKMKDCEKWYPGLIRWAGFHQTTVPVTHQPRPSGKSSYSMARLFSFAFEIIVLSSDRPLRITVAVGFVIAIVAFASTTLAIVRSFMLEVPLGWTSVVASIWFLSGASISLLGVFGLYLGKAISQVRGRPTYIIETRTNREF